MREAEKVEGLGLPVATTPSVAVRKAAELDQARLVGMQLQTKLSKSLAQCDQELLGLGSMLKAHNEIIRKAHHDHVAVRPLPTPLLDPEVEHVVQVEVGQDGADAAP